MEMTGSEYPSSRFSSAVRATTPVRTAGGRSFEARNSNDGPNQVGRSLCDSAACAPVVAFTPRV